MAAHSVCDENSDAAFFELTTRHASVTRTLWLLWCNTFGGMTVLKPPAKLLGLLIAVVLAYANGVSLSMAGLEPGSVRFVSSSSLYPPKDVEAAKVATSPAAAFNAGDHFSGSHDPQDGTGCPDAMCDSIATAGSEFGLDIPLRSAVLVPDQRALMGHRNCGLNRPPRSSAA